MNPLETAEIGKTGLEKYLNENPSSFSISRCYANGQTANQNGTAHSDSDIPNTFTFLYYPSRNLFPNYYDN